MPEDQQVDETTAPEAAAATDDLDDEIRDSDESEADVEDDESEDDESDDEDDSEDEDSEGDEGSGGSGRKGRSAKLIALDEEGDIAADYLEELLDIADLDGDIDTFTEGGRAHISIVTDANLLVGKDGEVLEALQELSRLAVMTETGKRSRLMLDIAGHREKRRAELTDLASDAVEEAKASGEAVRLSPMNPFERKIVHDVVAAAGLNSESDGEEPNRRVVVMPA
ncbi:R3H domain-containing nucleic acid-binding protein [Ammonicoccus fulvus]|uniref:R3H domain-containing nucleic acid-binding protein n=1 Tax=Ammonicoccus fulvus TaxID=3138240 RepID=A0ABZ3FTQ1_9ACTN